MEIKQFGLAALFAVAGAAMAIGPAPVAIADECDPAASVCQGPEVEGSGAPPDFAPAPDTDMGGAPSEMQLTDENPGIESPSHEGHR